MSNTTGVLIALLMAFSGRWESGLLGEQPQKHFLFLHPSLQAQWALEVRSLSCSLLGRRRRGVAFLPAAPPLCPQPCKWFLFSSCFAVGWDKPLAHCQCSIVSCVFWAKFVCTFLPAFGFYPVLLQKQSDLEVSCQCVVTESEYLFWFYSWLFGGFFNVLAVHGVSKAYQSLSEE